MPHESVRYETHDGVGLITLNRPDRLNAINWALIHDLKAILLKLQDDDQIRSVIITGAGKGFCVGADVQEMNEPGVKRRPPGVLSAVFQSIEDLPKIVIAAVNGPCNGAGLELALSCDFRIASDNANFGLGEVKLGLIPGAGGTARLPRLIGVASARKFLYFGDRISAEDALRIGMVDQVVSAGDLQGESMRWAGELAQRAPLSLRMLKSCLNKGMQMAQASAIEYEGKCVAVLQKSEDLNEGIRAFVEKRKPQFQGK
ncbi:MAG: enoyl-CoA hydratase/isomerase family protein [Syntrophobacteraceae bacterium]